MRAVGRPAAGMITPSASREITPSVFVRWL